MNWPIKLGLGLIALALAFFGGWYTRKPKTVTVTEVQTKVETQVQVKEVEKVIRQVVTRTVTKPDGTKIEKVTERTKSATDTQKSTQRRTEQHPPVPTLDPYRPDFSVGVKWDQLDPKPGRIEAGYRVLGNLWGGVEYDWRRREVAIGMRIEF